MEEEEVHDCFLVPASRCCQRRLAVALEQQVAALVAQKLDHLEVAVAAGQVERRQTEAVFPVEDVGRVRRADVETGQQARTSRGLCAEGPA